MGEMVTARKAFSHDQLLTDPDQAVDFVSRPRWMLWRLRLAPATALQVYAQTDREILAISRIEEIRLPNTHLVMHGSSVPEDLLAIINQYGGKIPETYGVPEIQKELRVVSVRLTLTQITA